jgi:hypothetical protein
MQQGWYIPLVGSGTLVSYGYKQLHAPWKTLPKPNVISDSCRNRNGTCAEVKLDIEEECRAGSHVINWTL